MREMRTVQERGDEGESTLLRPARKSHIAFIFSM